MSDILMEVKDKIAYVTLNRGPANAFVNEMYVEFANTLLELGERDDVAVVVVRANGKIFCGGNDISAFDSFDSRTKANYSAECCGKAAGARMGLQEAGYLCGTGCGNGGRHVRCGSQ